MTPGAAAARERRDDATAAFTIFGALWAIGSLFHQAAYTDQAFGLSGLLVSLPALWLLLRPQSLPRLMLLVLLQGAQVWRHGPAHVSNHWVFATAVNGTILLAFIVLAIQHRGKVRRSELFLTFAPAVRIELAVLYFFAVVHKLNTDFVDPAVSCATYQYGQIAALYSILPTGAWVDATVIYGTLLVEAAIPILLLIRRTRIAGVVLGVLFHFVLALNPQFVFFDFSSILFACFFLFIPYDFWTSLRDRPFQTGAGRWVRGQLGHGRLIRAARSLVAALVGFLVLAYLFRLTPDSADAENVMQETVRLAFVVYGIALLIFLWRGVRSTDLVERVRGLDRVRPSRAWMIIPPILLFLNGASPYLGLKTESSFGMFSNLRTEGETNHLFIPTSFKVAGLQDDLVAIEASSDPTMARVGERGVLLTWFDFRVRAARVPDASVTYRRNGERMHIPRIADAAVLAPPSDLARRLLAFRPISQPGEAVVCRH